MRVFVTGATGFIGSALVPELIQAGHRVVGMTRSEQGARALEAAGAEAHYGTIEAVETLRAGAAGADAVVHLAFDHDFSKFLASTENDRRAIEAMTEALAGSDRPFVGTGGVMLGNPNPERPYDEDDPQAPIDFPRASEEATLRAAEGGIHGMVVRLSQIHDPRRQGLITMMTGIALEKGVSAYVGDGRNRWAAAHVTDTARLYRLALEKGRAGSRWHAVGEEGVATQDVAEALGRRLGLPVVSIPPEASPAHFGFLSHFMAHDAPASSAKTRARLGWTPTGPGLIEDLDRLVLDEGA